MYPAHWACLLCLTRRATLRGFHPRWHDNERQEQAHDQYAEQAPVSSCQVECSGMLIATAAVCRHSPNMADLANRRDLPCATCGLRQHVSTVAAEGRNRHRSTFWTRPRVHGNSLKMERESSTPQLVAPTIVVRFGPVPSNPLTPDVPGHPPSARIRPVPRKAPAHTRSAQAPGGSGPPLHTASHRPAPLRKGAR